MIAAAVPAIDIVIIVSYMVGVLCIGTYFARYVRHASDFFLAGRALPFWAIGMSVVVSDIGAFDMVSGAGATYKYGIAQSNFDWIGSMPALLIAAFVFIPYYWRSGAYTIPEFLGRRYNYAVRLVVAVFWLIFLLAMLGVMLWVTAILMNEVLGIGEFTAIWLTVAVVGVYSVTGGLTAVVMTDVMQLIVMFVGAGALIVLSLWEAGGWSGMVEKVSALGPEFKDHFKLLLPHDTVTPYPWTGIVFGLGIVLSTSYFIANQAVVQRALGARSEWDAKAGMIFAGFLKMFIPVLIMLPGLAGLALHPGLEQPDHALPTMIRNVLPTGLRGLMFAAFFAALMSSVDSFLNSYATVFMSDIYTPIWKRLRGSGVSGRHALILGRLITAVVIVGAAAIAPLLKDRHETIYPFVQTMLSIFQGPTLAILLLGILWARTTGWGAFVGLLCGLGMTTSFTMMGGDIFPSDDPFLFVSMWSFLFSLLVTFVVSLITPRESNEKIRGLVFGQVLRDPDAQALLEKRMPGSDAADAGSTPEERNADG